MKSALFVVDVTPAFTEGGALPVPGGNAVAYNITTWLRLTNAAGRPITDHYDIYGTSQDWHNPLPDTNGGHFAADGNPDYVTTWPVHSLAGTPEAELHPDLHMPRIDIKVLKGQGRQDYSAFDGIPNGLTHITLAHFLREAGVEQVDVVGLALDHCVKATALDSVRAGFITRVITDLTAGVAPDTTAAALTEMRDAGVILVTKEVAW